jgi:hypothetical protein
MFSCKVAGAVRPRYGIVCALTSLALLCASFADAATAFKLSGAPVATIVAARYFSFQPGLSNPNGSRLTFAVSNRPSWARFDPGTGRLYGTPLPSSVGTFRNIVISASDGVERSVLPAYSITVLPLPNIPPAISGNAPTTVLPGQAYSFQPTARDPNGLRITFGIYNKPAWLTFDSATGRLYGTPGVTDAGVHSNIVITAYDGYFKAVLPAFSIAVGAAASQPATPPVNQAPAGPVTVQWLPPTQNTDGSALTNLAGYRVYYGTTTNLDHTITISNPGLARYVIGDLPPATWYFAMTAYNTNGQESDRSQIQSIVTP